MTKKVLSPHASQDGWVYIRAFRLPEAGKPPTYIVPQDNSPYSKVNLITTKDESSLSRIISSRRTEEGVELLDLIRLCQKHNFSFAYQRFVNGQREWEVWETDVPFLKGEYAYGRASTLREAFYRCLTIKEEKEKNGDVSQR